MATISTSHHFAALTLLFFFFKIKYADPSSNFSFTHFGEDSIFKSNVALHGDAKVVNGGYALQLSGSVDSAATYKKPIKLVEGNPRKSVSFSTYLAFSMPSNESGGLSFFMSPSGFKAHVLDNSSRGISLGLRKRKFKFVAVEFSVSAGAKNGNNTKSRVAITVNSLVSAHTRNSSFVYFGLGSGKKLQAWIDYEASSKQFEVRLSKYGDLKPSDALLWLPVDFFKMWKLEEGVVVGLSPLKWKPSATCFVYSWSFLVRLVPHWMHSEPLDPMAFAHNIKPVVSKPRSDCLLKILAGTIFGAGSGALAAFILLYVWTIFGNKRPVVPEDFALQPVDYEYKKVVHKAIEDVKKVNV